MKPTGAHREELIDELLSKERQIAKLKDQLKEQTKALRDRIGGQEERRDELLDLLDGREHVEPELPLVGGKADRRGPGLSVALKEHGAHIPAGEERAAKAELARRGKRGKATEAP